MPNAKYSVGQHVKVTPTGEITTYTGEIVSAIQTSSGFWKYAVDVDGSDDTQIAKEAWINVI
jgi:hypothetical protein